MSSHNTHRSTRRDVVLVFIAGVMLAFGVLSVVLAGRRADAADEAAVRVVSGCESVVELPAAGRYLVSIEVAGPSLSTTQACREVPAGSRTGTLVGIRVVAKSGAAATLPLSDVNASRLVAGGQRGSLGVVDVDVAGEYVLEFDATGDVVATIGSDPSVIRSSGWWWGVGWLVGALVAGLLVVGTPSRRRNQAVGAADWAAPLPADRIG